MFMSVSAWLSAHSAVLLNATGILVVGWLTALLLQRLLRRAMEGPFGHSTAILVSKVVRNLIVALTLFSALAACGIRLNGILAAAGLAVPAAQATLKPADSMILAQAASPLPIPADSTTSGSATQPATPPAATTPPATACAPSAPSSSSPCRWRPRFCWCWPSGECRGAPGTACRCCRPGLCGAPRPS